MKKFNRRQFGKYISSAAISAAFLKTISMNRAFGAVPGKNLIIFSHPNGHKNWQLTRQAVNASGMANRALLSSGMFYNTNGISHGGSANLLRFNANQGGSFDSDIEKVVGSKALRLAIDFNPNQNADIMCRDENGQLGQIYSNPQKAFDDVFGGVLNNNDANAQAEIYSGKASLVDHCLEDVNRLKSELGSLGSLFDDNIAALVDLQRDIAKLQMEAAAENADTANQCATPNLSFPTGASAQNYNAYFEIMAEIMFQAITCTKIQTVVFQMSNAQSDMSFNFPGSPVNSNAGFHGGLVHGTNRGAQYQQIVSWYIQKVASFAGRLANTGGDVLADSAVVHLSEMGIADHSTRDIPFIVYGELGGTIRTGRMMNGNSSVSSFLKAATDSIYGPVVGQGVTPMTGLG